MPNVSGCLATGSNQSIRVNLEGPAPRSYGNPQVDCESSSLIWVNDS